MQQVIKHKVDRAVVFSFESTRTENEEVRSKTSLDFWTKLIN